MGSPFIHLSRRGKFSGMVAPGHGAPAVHGFHLSPDFYSCTMSGSFLLSEHMLVK